MAVQGPRPGRESRTDMSGQETGTTHGISTQYEAIVFMRRVPRFHPENLTTKHLVRT
jgi:hypothetical protein